MLRQICLCVHLAFFSVHPSIALADTTSKPSQKVLSSGAARSLADKEFTKVTGKKVDRFEVQELKEGGDEFVFVYEARDVAPRPGSEMYISVDKRNRKLTWWYGK